MLLLARGLKLHAEAARPLLEDNLDPNVDLQPRGLDADDVVIICGPSSRRTTARTYGTSSA